MDFTYAQTLAAISTGGLFEGWQVARTRFVSDYEGEELAGFIDYVHEGNFGSLYKSNIGAPVSSVGESGGNVGWLLYRTEGGSVPPPAGVPEPATFALFGLGLAGLGVMRRRRRT